MREILFRGKRIDNGEWIEGYYVHLYDGKGNESHRIYTGYSETDCGDFYPEWFEVDPETVGQFIGLHDKKGKKIFKGDIVRCGTGRICKVTFFSSPGFSGFDFVATGGFDAPPPHNWVLFTDTEVIGNIHDNKELLEG